MKAKNGIWRRLVAGGATGQGVDVAGMECTPGPRTDSRRSSRRLDGSEEQRYNEQGCAKTAVPHVGSKDLMCRAA